MMLKTSDKQKKPCLSTSIIYEQARRVSRIFRWTPSDRSCHILMNFFLITRSRGSCNDIDVATFNTNSQRGTPARIFWLSHHLLASNHEALDIYLAYPVTSALKSEIAETHVQY